MESVFSPGTAASVMARPGILCIATVTVLVILAAAAQPGEHYLPSAHVSVKKKKRSLVPRQLLAERSRKTLSGNENRDEATAMLGSYKVKPLVTPQKSFFFFLHFLRYVLIF